MGRPVEDLLALGRALSAAAAGGDNSQKPLKSFDAAVRHSELRAASRSLFGDSHYSRAVEEGAKALIAFVQDCAGHPKDRQGFALEGTPLMEHVFSKGEPKLRVNAGTTRDDLDEQEGYMYLFKATVLMGRNPRVHNHRKKDTPDRALALLALFDHLFAVAESANRVSP